MPRIPESILERCPPIKGLKLLHRGKVRDTYQLPDYPELLLVVASDRVSVFDCVLNGLIRDKGAVLTAMSYFWTKKLLVPFFKTDFVACGVSIDGYLPEPLQNNPDRQKRATVVKKFESPQIEDIVRFHLTGSGFKDYAKTGKVCGHSLPPGLIDGSRLPTPLYTPSTKATEGHDENISVHDVTAKWGVGQERHILMAAGTAYQHAQEKGIILADTKLEMHTVLIDEKFTPDSSRFWDQRQWEVAHAEGKLPPPMDKQVVRNYILNEFETRGMGKPDPSIPYHLAVLDNLVLPDHIVQETTFIYRNIFQRLTGTSLDSFQKAEMGIAA